MPDAGAMIGTASKLITQVSSGLATWARNIHFEPFRLRVNGTAGSGKTQLAIGVLHDAAAAGNHETDRGDVGASGGRIAGSGLTER